MKYSDQFVDWLVEEGYTHCFFVAGGNIMHLLNSVRTRLTCVPFVNEVGAAIAAEYFTATSAPGAGKAFLLVTAGPGLTNAITGISSAWMESRELLVVGGQVKSTDLLSDGIRQRGIQEIDGVTLIESICKTTMRVITPAAKDDVLSAVRLGAAPRKGPVFIEMCLDAQAASVEPDDSPAAGPLAALEPDLVPTSDIDHVAGLLAKSERPILLLGNGISRAAVSELDDKLRALGVPVMLTWNGIDRIPSDHPLYAGRPNTWGQRAANASIQQADLVIALGTRLGLQQTGFAWQDFVPVGSIVQVDVDAAELAKGHPHVEVPLRGEANDFLGKLLDRVEAQPRWADWLEFIGDVQDALPLNDPANVTGAGYVDPYQLLLDLGPRAGSKDVVISGSSGGPFTVTMQAFQPRGEQRVLSDKGMASMGYGLSGSIGAALGNLDVTTYLVEGDGGFAQNLQELGTVAVQGLRLKILLLSNNGYASIRTTQRNYFDGAWIGCDTSTGLGLPDWQGLAAAFRIPYAVMDPADPFGGKVGELLESDGPAFIEVPIDPEQTYFPKINSAVQSDGSMKSNPLHRMSPDLPVDVAARVYRFIEDPYK